MTNKKNHGKPSSTVRNNQGKIEPTKMPAGARMKEGLLPVSDKSQLHVNDIRRLKPHHRWTVLIDETGNRFNANAAGTIALGRFIACIVPNGGQTLPSLGEKWHAVNVDAHARDVVIQSVLDEENCGVFGVTLDALEMTPGCLWVDGITMLMDWILRLLPVEGPTHISFKIEQRAEHHAGSDWSAIVAYARRLLSRAFPSRAQMIKVDVEVIGKDGHDLLGYADAIAHVWGSPSSRSKVRMKNTGWHDTCLLTCDSHDFRRAWDAYDRGVDLSAELWRDFLAEKDAGKEHNVVKNLLDQIADECRTNVKLWQRYLQMTSLYLKSKAIDLDKLAHQIEWLQNAQPSSAKMPSALRLAWLTAQLARSNHDGQTEQAWKEEFAELSEKLLIEDAPLVCHADLHQAVECTNRFEFERARKMLSPWYTKDPAIPGLRYWGKVCSSYGQHEAFMGNSAEAIPYFDKAVESFGKLSDGGIGDCRHTLCYRAIAMMDDPQQTDDDVMSAMQAVLGGNNLVLQAGKYARGMAAKDKYNHHIILRWACTRTVPSITQSYLAQQDAWQIGDGHPWPLIEAYRGILLYPTDQAAAREHMNKGAKLAFEARQGPTVQFIGAVLRTIAHQWGDTWDAADAVHQLQSLKEALPHAHERVAILERTMHAHEKAEPLTLPLTLLQACLPFNFH